MTTPAPGQRAAMPVPRRAAPPRRFILTGAPGAGKTAVARELAGRGWAVVAEAATDVIAAGQARGIDAPWEQGDFLETILRLQQQRASQPGGTPVQVFDRSPVCTLALARYAEQPVAPALADEVARIVDQTVYQRDVFYFQPLGFVVPTSARRISYADSLRFGAIHREVYQELGFRLVDVGVDSVARRADLVEDHLHLAVQRMSLRG